MVGCTKCFIQRFGAWRSGGLEVQMFKLALMLIEVQMLNLALMPPFCQTPVGGSAFCSFRPYCRNCANEPTNNKIKEITK